MKKLLCVSCLLLSLAFGLAGCSEPQEGPVQGEGPQPSVPSTPAEPETPETPAVSGGYEGVDGGVSFRLPDLGKCVLLHTDLQKAYLEDDYGAIRKYADGVNATEEVDHRELSAPLPVSFTWEAEGAADGEYVLRVGEGEEMQNVWSFTTTETSLEVYNLKLATTYYWSVTAGNAESGKASFTTEGQGPRNLYIEGVANVRDLGGWTTESGARVKQGLIYRCGRLNENYTGKTTIAEAGISAMLEKLQIRTEIDLRGGSGDPTEHGNITKSPLGEGVSYFHIGMNWQGSLMDMNRPKIRQVFEILSNESSYPLIFHCSIGTDRTGLIAFLVGGLLGVSEEDLYRDYLFSNFAYIEGSRELTAIKNSYVADIKGAAGSDLAEKVRNTLIDRLRVPEEQVDAVARILSNC